MKLSCYIPAASIPMEQPVQAQPKPQALPSDNPPDTFARTTPPQFAGGCSSVPVEAQPSNLINASANNLSKKQVQALLKDLYINEATDGDNNTAVMTAVKRGDKRMTKILVELGADATIANRHGDFPLKEAALQNRKDIAQIILDSRQVSRYDQNDQNQEEMIDQKDRSGRTALMHAANSGHPRMVQFLLTQGADRNEVDDNDQNALTLATRRRAAIRNTPGLSATERGRLVRNYTDIILLLTPKPRTEIGNTEEKKF